MLRLLFAGVAASATAVALGACVNMDAAGDDPECTGPVTSGPVVETIRVLEHDGAAGNVKGAPVEVGERMFWPGYVSVLPDGKVMTRDMLIAEWRPKPWASSFEIQDLEIQLFCDTAIVVGLSQALWTGAPEGSKPIHFRWTNVWTRRHGEWRLSASQFTRF